MTVYLIKRQHKTSIHEKVVGYALDYDEAETILGWEQIEVPWRLYDIWIEEDDFDQCPVWVQNQILKNEIFEQ